MVGVSMNAIAKGESKALFCFGLFCFVFIALSSRLNMLSLLKSLSVSHLGNYSLV